MTFRKKALLSTIASDSHSWNLVFMEFFLNENGYDVVNLGPCTQVEDVTDALDKGYYDLVVISTVNGHGAYEGPELAEEIRDVAGFELDLVIGGKIATRNDTKTIRAAKAELRKAGFDAVFDDSEKNTFDAFQAFIDRPRGPAVGLGQRTPITEYLSL